MPTRHSINCAVAVIFLVIGFTPPATGDWPTAATAIL